jgi:two-component system chemotaxis sensor kinase CheA
MIEQPERFTVLIVDDEPLVRASLGRFLRHYGYAAIEAATVEQAIELVQGTPVQAVILDVRMPGGRSGLDVLAPLRANPALARIPVLILTGAFLSEDEELTITRYRAHLFHKPEGYDTLVTFLDQLTGRDRSH